MRPLFRILPFFFACPAFLGAQLIWQPGGAGTALHGDGTWDTTSATWTTDPNGLDPAFAWISGDVAHFGANGSGYTVTVGAGISIGGLLIDGTYNHLTFAGNDFALTGATPTITLGAAIPTPTFEVGFSGSTGLSIVANDTSSIDLTAPSSYTGVTTLDGTGESVEVYLRDANSLGASGSGNGTVANGDVRLLFGGTGPSLTVAEDFTLNTSGAIVAQSSTVTLTGSLSLGHDLTIDPDENTLEITGNISETAAGKGLRITDTGTVILSGSNTFTGDLVVERGTVSVATLANAGQASNAGAGSALVLGKDNGEGVDDAQLTYTGGTASTNRAIQLAGDVSTINVSNLATFLTVSGAITNGSGNGDHGLEKSGPGRLILTGNNSYSGNTMVTNGALIVGSNTALGTGAEVEIGTSGTGAYDKLNLLLMDGVTLAQDVDIYNQNSMEYTSIGSYGTNGTATFAGDVYIQRSIYVNANAGGGLNFNGYFSDGSGGGSILKDGSGFARFGGGIDLRGGGIDVQAGEAILTGSVILADSITVRANATVSGNAVITHASPGSTGILVEANGTLSPGLSVGTLTTPELTFNSGANLLWQMNGLSTSDLTQFDNIVVNSTATDGLQVDATAQLTVDLSLLAVSLRPQDGNAFWMTEQIWKVIDFEGAGNNQLTPGSYAPLTMVDGMLPEGIFDTFVGGGSGAWAAFDSGDVFLRFQPVPEPSTWVLLAVGGALAGWRRRRRRA